MIFKSLQVFPALAVNHPATAKFVRDVTHGKQLANIGQQQSYSAIFSNYAQCLIKVIRQFVHAILMVLNGENSKIILNGLNPYLGLHSKTLKLQVSNVA